MRIANLILCILNILCLALNLYVGNYTVAIINAIAVVATTSAFILCK